MVNSTEYQSLTHAVYDLIDFLTQETIGLEDHQFELIGRNVKKKEELCFKFENCLQEIEQKNKLALLPAHEKADIRELLAHLRAKFFENRDALEKAQRFHKLLVELCLMNKDPIKVPSYTQKGIGQKTHMGTSALSTFDQDI